VVAYEILLMLDPDLPEGRQEEIIKRARELVEKANGTWVRHDVWGRRRLAYEIGHKGEGSYHLLNFDADAELSRILRITDGVMRHLAVRRVEGSAPGPPPPEPDPVPARSVPEPAYAESNTSSEEE
jgi:small subunit ribosomal protein S6